MACATSAGDHAECTHAPGRRGVKKLTQIENTSPNSSRYTSKRGGMHVPAVVEIIGFSWYNCAPHTGCLRHRDRFLALHDQLRRSSTQCCKSSCREQDIGCSWFVWWRNYAASRSFSVLCASVSHRTRRPRYSYIASLCSYVSAVERTPALKHPSSHCCSSISLYSYVCVCLSAQVCF